MTSTLPTSDECVRCGYLLHGINNDAPCPECGLLAERSRRPSDELHDSRPRWLRRLSFAVWVMIFALLAQVLFPLVVEPLAERLFYRLRSNTYWMVHYSLMSISSIACSMILLLGIHLLTGPEGYAAADLSDRRRRRVLRLVAVLLLLAAVARCANEILVNRFWIRGIGPPPAWLLHLNSYLPVVVALVATPLPLLIFYQLRSLARRARSAHLAEHCAIVGIGASLGLLYVAIAIIVDQAVANSSAGTYWHERSNIFMAITLLVAVVASLFWLWSLYLLIRFAIAFGKASRTLRKKWQRDDRAAAPHVG